MVAIFIVAIWLYSPASPSVGSANTLDDDAVPFFSIVYATLPGQIEDFLKAQRAAARSRLTLLRNPTVGYRWPVQSNTQPAGTLRRVMAALGRFASVKKAAAARANCNRGGRPRKLPEIVLFDHARIMKEKKGRTAAPLARLATGPEPRKRTFWTPSHCHCEFRRPPLWRPRKLLLTGLV